MSLLLQTVKGQGTHRPDEVRLLDEYLERFSEREQAVRDLLTVQAFAEFPGPPADELWAELATALSRKTYGAGDVAQHCSAG
jgi:hypothetical protein